MAHVIRGFFICSFAYLRSKKYTKIQNSRTFPRLHAISESIRYQIQLCIAIFRPYSTPSFFAIFCQNVSTANYEGCLYLFQNFQCDEALKNDRIFFANILETEPFHHVFPNKADRKRKYFHEIEKKLLLLLLSQKFLFKVWSS